MWPNRVAVPHRFETRQEVQSIVRTQMAYKTLVDTQLVANHLNDPEWVIFDCRHDLADPGAGAAAYRSGHIPTACFAHLDRNLAGRHSGTNGRHPLPERQELAAFLGRHGVRPGTQLVAYDAQGGMFAARLWWLARWLGHSEVAVLDGGWQQWKLENRPVTQDVPEPRPGNLTPAAGVQAVNAAFVESHLSDAIVVDARSPDRYRGENEILDPVGGRIPGARNRFFRDNLDEQGRFKSPARLSQDFEALLNGNRADTVIHSCGSGVSACHNLLAMEIAGMPGSRLYAGSWSEWCSDSARPIARG